MQRRVRNYYGANSKVLVDNPNGHEKQNRDTIPAIVQEGSLVIPIKFVDLVIDFMRRHGIPINERNMPINRKDAVDVVLVRHELVIQPRWVPEITRFLKSKRIFLPGMK